MPACQAGGQGQAAGVQPVEQHDGGPDSLADRGELAVGRRRAVVALAQPAQQVPDRVAVQQFLIVTVTEVAKGGVDPVLEPGEVFIAGGQRAGGDQDGAQVLDRFAGRHLVEGVVGQRPLAPGEAGQDRGRGVLRQPAQHRARPVSRGQGLVEHAQLGPDAAGAVVEQLPQALVQGAPGAAARGAEPLEAAAGHARRLRERARGQACRAQRGINSAAADGADLAAPGAAGPALPAGRAPGLASRGGDRAGHRPAADRAVHDLPGPAAPAQRPVSGAGGDAAAPAAGNAVLQVGRVVDQAVRAQRPAVGIPGGGLAGAAAA